MKDNKVNSVNVINARSAGKPLDFEPLITIAEAARLLGLNEQTLYGWIHEGKFEGLKLGNKSVRVRPEAVRAFLDAAQKEARLRVA